MATPTTTSAPEKREEKVLTYEEMVEEVKVMFPAVVASPSEPFANDEDFLNALQAQHCIKKQYQDSETSMLQAALTASSHGRDVEQWKKEMQYQEMMKRLADQVETTNNSRLEAMKAKNMPLPRLLRYAEKVPFTPKELELVTKFLISQIGNNQSSFNMYTGDILSSGIVCKMSINEIMEFVNEDRKHMKQGLFADFYAQNFLRNSITFSNEALKFFVGAKLTSDEFLKIDKTIMSEVLEEEDPQAYALSKEKMEFYTSSPQMSSKPFGFSPFGDFGDTVSEGGKTSSEVGEKDTEMEKGEDQEDGFTEIKEDNMEAEKEEPQEEEEVDIITILQDVKNNEAKNTKAVANDDSVIKPYTTDLEYLDDHFQHLQTKMKVNQHRAQDDDYGYDNNNTNAADAKKRKLEAKCNLLYHKIERRMNKTKESGEWVPRLERLVSARKLDDNEKNIVLILIGGVICRHDGFRYANNVSGVTNILCKTLEEQISFRKYFYKNATLVKEGFIKLAYSGMQGDLSVFPVEIDRRMLDFVVGLDTEFSEIVEGSQLYFPKNKIESVILPDYQKKMILETVSNSTNFRKWKKKMGLGEFIPYGNGVVLLFYGPSGTGKTMMANSIANHLNKKVLLINFPTLRESNDSYKFIFREAKINDAILFFDECESIFESRNSGSYEVNSLLTEIERHEGLIIMATNRPFDFDEAMHRRITRAIEFKKPDHLLREIIWKTHLPPKIKLSDDINWPQLSLKFELTGGLIKNAIMSALSIAVSRDSENPVLVHDDLVQGAKWQLKGHLQMTSFESRLVPRAGLDDCMLEGEITGKLGEIINAEKARAVLFGQWGFGDNMDFNEGTTALFYGPPGTGKTMAAQAIGYEIGMPLKVVNCSELLSKANIDAIFMEASITNAIVVFDEAEVIFGKRDDKNAVDKNVVMWYLYNIANFNGITILTTNSIDSIDPAIVKKMKYVLRFAIPSAPLRAKLWRNHIPAETPVDSKVHFMTLATKFEIGGGNIKKAVFKAACRAALRPSPTQLTMDDLMLAASEEAKKMEVGFVNI